MGNVLFRQAFAKINVHLGVGAPFSDGYHPIESIFALVDLADTIEVSWKESKNFSVTVKGLEEYCTTGSDTLSRAAMLWFAKSHLPLTLTVTCNKQIPVKAGLGGGSSDAAALLLLLQEIAGVKAVASADLVDIGLQVGSDVPFFLSGYSCALVEGRGEKVTKLELGSKPLLLAMPKEYAISTGEAYRAIDAMRGGSIPGPRPSLEDVLSLLGSDPVFWNGVFYNDFEMCTDYPQFYDVIATLSHGYEGFGCLTGSGSCWFFLAENIKSVVELHEVIHERFLDSVQLWCTRLI
ncbi:hypothetical protein [Sphaerochaeta sp. PS]|uniref:4-(cytidine 5'-diphospho)-2-C-methyl-D-erythritol kinase n=1 Tax=Sphaerochaeta sp. PS TaxID=3076336 RepID=UPI0028A4E6B8|nr:hypothetical protein [Sphaerochaeta sp. PS]MDT4762401.1 hypothetical protein [Sphaerochaeta sp. PS]